MLGKVFYSRTAAALAVWIALFTAAFYLLAALTPAWFGELSWSQTILLGSGLSLVTLLLLAVTAALFAQAFRKIKPAPAACDGPALHAELERTKERLKRAEERLDGAQVVAAVGRASIRKSLHLTDAERERLSKGLIAVGSYLDDDFEREIAPMRALLAYEPMLDPLSGGSGPPALQKAAEDAQRAAHDFPAKLEAVCKPYAVELNLADIDPLRINAAAGDEMKKTLFSIASVAINMREPNVASVELSGEAYRRAFAAFDEELQRVKCNIAGARRRLANGELGSGTTASTPLDSHEQTK